MEKFLEEIHSWQSDSFVAAAWEKGKIIITSGRIKECVLCVLLSF